MVLKGEASEALLDSYEAERRPVGLLTVGQAYTRYVRRVTPEEVDENTPALRDELTMELGQFYPSGAVVGGRAEDQPACLHPDETRGAPGSRVPYAWLTEAVSTIDCAKDGFALLRGPDGGQWDDRRFATWTVPHEALHRFGIGPTGAMLVRPDGFVAARVEDQTDSFTVLNCLLAQVTGR